MHSDTAYATNQKFIKKLAEAPQWAVQNLLDDSWAQGLYWLINSGTRTPMEQLALWRKGRFPVWNPKKQVTWTLNSDHVKGLAIDLTMLEGSYDQVDDVGRIYGIHRVPELIAKHDFGHYTLVDAIREPQPPVIDPEARRKGLIRRMNNTTDGDRRRIIGAVLARLEDRLRRDGIPF